MYRFYFYDSSMTHCVNNKHILTTDETAIAKAVQLLRAGYLVAFPTETVYGLGADASNADAVKGIFAAKGRPANHPLIVHIASAEQLQDWATEIPDTAGRLAAAFWPGPLALVLRKQAWVPLAVTGGQDTVALRVPNHPVALRLLQAFGGGIAAPSANRFCRISPTQADHVQQELGERVALILDGGSCQVGVESAIVDLTGEVPVLLRPGQLKQPEIESVLKTKLLLAHHLTAEIRAPGMMAVHYAPQTLTRLCSAKDLAQLASCAVQRGQRIAVLSYQQPLLNNPAILAKQMPQNADDYARLLYARLRELDELGMDEIWVEQPPETPAWQAINDRLRKAATN